MSDQMLRNNYFQMQRYPSGYSNWGILALWNTYPFYEVAITGEGVVAKQTAMNSEYLPNKLLLGAKKKSHLPLLEGKFMEDETTIFVCENKACLLPVLTVVEALKLMD